MSDTIPKDSTNFSYEFKAPLVKGAIKRNAEDFQVSERLKFELNGEGQHLCLFVEKKFLNTQDALSILSRFFQVPPKSIGYFGLKDKVAVTRQWFSVDIASSKLDADSALEHCDTFQSVFPALLEQSMGSRNKKNAADEVDLSKKHPAQMKILEISKNRKKFKIGQLAGNNFELVIRDINNLSQGEKSKKLNSGNAPSGFMSADVESQLSRRLEYIKEKGFPNYFGEQRFGRDNQNIELLKKNIESDLSKRRALRGRVISTFRALAFNRYLSERIDDSTARQYVEGDVLQFSDGNSVFSGTASTDDTNKNVETSYQIQQRIDQGKVVISGPLVGVDESLAKEQSLMFEEAIIRKFRTYAPVLDRYQVKTARRSLFAKADNLTWYFSENDLFLKFDLDAGSFATSLVRELVMHRPEKQNKAEQNRTKQNKTE